MILKKFHWGWGIAIFYGAFVAFMLFMVWQSTVMKTELVTSDYYGKELKYQDRLDKMKRSNILGDTLRWEVANGDVKLNFPAQVKGRDVRANILFYKPDNSLRDFSVSCTADSSGICLVKSEKFVHGAYKIEVDWSADKVTYYNEGVINMN